MADESATKVHEFSVLEISAALKRIVNDSFGNVRVRSVHTSEHAYFSLKDDTARIEAVIWRGSFSKLKAAALSPSGHLPARAKTVVLDTIATGAVHRSRDW